MKTYNLLFILMLLTGLMACRKDKSLPPVFNNNQECQEFETLPSFTFFSNERYQFQTPYFNPNNANEFVYNYKDYELNEFKLLKYNLQTGVKTEVATNVKIISQPKWSRKGWVAFDNVYNQNYQIWIVKDNGDSLTQFSTIGGNIFPVWDSSGDNLFLQSSPNAPPAIPYFFVKQSLYNTIIDTIMRDGDANNGYAGYSDISVDNQLLTNTFIGNESHLAYSDINSISFNSIFNINQVFFTDYIRGLTWSNNSQTAYFTLGGGEKRGMYSLNATTGTYTKLMSFCDTKRYKSISCSPDGKKLIAERVDSYLVKDNNDNPTGQIVENSSIYLIDLETMEETKINLE